MGKRIKITAGEVEAFAELNDTELVETIWEALPIEASTSTWGDEIYFEIPVKAGRPVAQVAHIYRLLRHLASGFDRDFEIDLVAPGGGGSLNGQRLPDRLGQVSVVKLCESFNFSCRYLNALSYGLPSSSRFV